MILAEAVMSAKTLGVGVSGRGEFIGEAPDVATNGGIVGDVARRFGDDSVVLCVYESRRTRRYG